MKFIKMLMIMLTVCAFAENAAQAQQTPVEILTLEKAIETALQNNTSVKNDGLEIKKIGFAESAYRTRRLPQFEVSTSISQPLTRLAFTIEKGQFGDFANTGPIPSTRTTIRSSFSPTILISAQVQQPLSQLYEIKLNLKKFAVNKEMSEEQFRQKRQTITAEIKNVYFQIMQTESVLKTAEESLKLSREVNRVTEQYVKEGYVLASEKLETETKVAQAEYQILMLGNRLSTQKEQLNYLLGRDVRTDFTVVFPASFLNIAETDLAEAQKRALERRPEIRLARLRIKETELDRRIKKSEFIPEVSLSASYLSPFNFSTFLPKNIVNVGVSVKWEVFDWGRKKVELAEKQVSAEQAENSLRETENLILMEVSAKFRKLKESAEQLRIAQMSQKAARANLQIALYRYQQQIVLYKDVLQIQTALSEADMNYQTALLSFWTAKAEFEKVLGEEK